VTQGITNASGMPSRAERRRMGVKLDKPKKGSPLRRLDDAEIRRRGVAKPEWMESVYMDDRHMVMTSLVDTEWGQVTQLLVRRHDLQPVRSWKDMQRIKNAVCGEERVAVEVYPPESELVDDANIYHLWVMPAGFRLPFGLGHS
jgi:hypothetical protein